MHRQGVGGYCCLLLLPPPLLLLIVAWHGLLLPWRVRSAIATSAGGPRDRRAWNAVLIVGCGL